MPETTLRAFADHGDAAPYLTAQAPEAAETLRRLEEADVDLGAVTAALEREGVRSFCDSYRQLLDCVERKAGAVQRIS